MRWALCGKSESFAAIHGSPLFLPLSAGSHPLASFPKGVGMPCGLFSNSRSEGGFLRAHMSTLSLCLHVQNAHDTGQSLHGLTGQREAGQVWPLGGIAHGDVYPGQWRGLDTVVTHASSRKIENTASNFPSKFSEFRHTLRERDWPVG